MQHPNGDHHPVLWLMTIPLYVVKYSHVDVYGTNKTQTTFFEESMQIASKSGLCMFMPILYNQEH